MAMDENYADADEDHVNRMWDDIEESIENDPSFWDDSDPEEPEGSYYHFFDDEGNK